MTNDDFFEDDSIFDVAEPGSSSNRLLIDESNLKQGRLSKEELLESFERPSSDRLKLMEEIQKLRARQAELSKHRPGDQGPEHKAQGDLTQTTQARQYEYHAQQLDRFLQEYRTLQDQLYKMKESCDSMQQRKPSLSKGSR